MQVWIGCTARRRLCDVALHNRLPLSRLGGRTLKAYFPLPERSKEEDSKDTQTGSVHLRSAAASSISSIKAEVSSLHTAATPLRLPVND